MIGHVDEKPKQKIPIFMSVSLLAYYKISETLISLGT